MCGNRVGYPVGQYANQVQSLLHAVQATYWTVVLTSILEHSHRLMEDDVFFNSTCSVGCSHNVMHDGVTLYTGQQTITQQYLTHTHAAV